MADYLPGTPLAEQMTGIAARLKEIEEERAKERQAGALPSTDAKEEAQSRGWFG